MNSFKQSGSTLPVHSVKACVVYDTSDGRIYHQHRVLTLSGGREPTHDEMAIDALRFVSAQHEAKKPTLAVLGVPHDAIVPGKRYRVHLARKELAAD